MRKGGLRRFGSWSCLSRKINEGFEFMIAVKGPRGGGPLAKG